MSEPTVPIDSVPAMPGAGFVCAKLAPGYVRCPKAGCGKPVWVGKPFTVTAREALTAMSGHIAEAHPGMVRG